VVETYGAAFGALGKNAEIKKVSSSAATSASRGTLFHRVVLSALQSVGATSRIGLTTNATCQLAVEHHHAAGGLMI